MNNKIKRYALLGTFSLFAAISISVVIIALRPTPAEVQETRLIEAAENGDAAAQTRLGHRARDAGQHDIAFQWYQKAAAQNDPEALNALGIAYENGEGVETDTDKAIELFTRAYNLKSATAAANLGRAYIAGDLIEQDTERGFALLLEAAQQDYAPAARAVGSFYLQGKNVEQNTENGLKWLNFAVERGDSIAIHTLAVAYDRGFNVKRDIEKAARLYARAASAGSPDAHRMVSESVRICRANINKIVENLLDECLIAAEAGDAESTFAIGRLFNDGVFFEKDFDKGFDFNLRAANAGDLRAMFYLGMAYEQGDNTPRDLTESLTWFYVIQASEDQYVKYDKKIRRRFERQTDSIIHAIEQEAGDDVRAQARIKANTIKKSINHRRKS